MIIDRYSKLVLVYQELGPGDTFIGRIPDTPTKATMLLDLTARGVRLLPSATSQMLNGSKISQVLLLGDWMIPHTKVITRRRELLDALGQYHKEGIAEAVTKHEHLHCGHGVRRWADPEILYSVMSLDDRNYPFVLQPFVTINADLRVVVVGNYREAYARNNTSGFRMNLAAGGTSQPFGLTGDLNRLCDKIMGRGQMPYAHIDLMMAEGERYFLSEISLGGGLNGARIDKLQLDRMKQERLTALADEVVSQGKESS